MPELPDLIRSYTMGGQPVWLRPRSAGSMPIGMSLRLENEKTTLIEIPDKLLTLACMDDSRLAYIEGALVHARLLARPGAASSVGLARVKLSDIASASDLHATMESIHTRLWSIELSRDCQRNVAAFIMKILEGIPDPIGRAAAIVAVLDASNINPLTVDVPAGLGRLLPATDRIQQALAWVEYVQVHHGSPDERIEFSACMNRARPKITLELMLQLGAPSRQLERATMINRGMNLILLASLVRWVREVVRLGGDKVTWSLHVSSSSWQYRQLLDRTSLLYGLDEAADPSKLTYNQACIAAAITRMTDYNKSLLKRVKAKQEQ